MASYVIEEILKKRKITEYLASKGIHPASHDNGKIKYHCPLHEGDNDPSFMVYTNSEFENFYCYGCLEENELIWTTRGLVPIKEVAIGDSVLDHRGKTQNITHWETKQAEVMSVKLASFRDPLLLTPDHRSLIVTKEIAMGAVRQLFNHRGRVVWRKDLSDRPVRNQLSIAEVEAGGIKAGDYFVFPVISEHDRYVGPLSGQIAEYTKGPRVRRIKQIPVTPDTAWFYGLYVAEGSFAGRAIRLTLHIDELPYANRVADVLSKYFGLDSSIDIRTDRNTCEVICCNVDLGKILAENFGKGACNKKVPQQSLWWDVTVQKAFLDGYRCGDGRKKNGSIVTCSKKLATAVFGISIQAGEYPSFGKPSRVKIRNGVNHKECYGVYFRRQEGAKGFYRKIDDVVYYFSPVTELKRVGHKQVVDISVRGSETFCCKLGATHNCRRKYHIIHLVCEFEKISFKEAIKQLSGGLDIDVDSEINHAIREIEEDKSIWNEYTPIQLSLMISRLVYDFLNRVEYETNYLKTCETLLKTVDKAVETGNLLGLKKIYDQLPDVLLMKVREYDALKEQRIRTGAKERVRD